MKTNNDTARGRARRYLQQIRARSDQAGSTASVESSEAKPAGPVNISVIDYDPNVCTEKSEEKIDKCKPHVDEHSRVSWINIIGNLDVSTFGQLRDLVNANEKTMRRLSMVAQRPHADVFDSYIHITLRSFDYKEDQVTSERINILFGEQYVITTSETGEVLADVKERILANEERVRLTGADYLVAEIVDAIADQHFGVLDSLGDRIEAVEDMVIERATPQVLKEIKTLKSSLIYIRSGVWPLREAMDKLSDIETTLVAEKTRPYFQEQYDRAVSLTELIETFRDLLDGVLDIYLSSVSLKLNDIMKVLALVGAIFLPLSFLVGFYGMNFAGIPGIDSPYGFPAFVIIMFLIAISLLVYFARAGWLRGSLDEE